VEGRERKQGGCGSSRNFWTIRAKKLFRRSAKETGKWGGLTSLFETVSEGLSPQEGGVNGTSWRVLVNSNSPRGEIGGRGLGVSADCQVSGRREA